MDLIHEIDAKSVIVLTFLCALIECTLHWIQNKGSRPSIEEIALQKQHAILASQAKKLNSVDMFVEHSKLLRQINNIKKQEQGLAVERIAKATVPGYIGYAQPIILAVIVVLYWSTPLVVFPPGRLMPIERLVAMPLFPAGVISAGGYWLICRRVMARLLK